MILTIKKPKGDHTLIESLRATFSILHFKLSLNYKVWDSSSKQKENKKLVRMVILQILNSVILKKNERIELTTTNTKKYSSR